MKITTTHTLVGYETNVKLVENILRTHFGLDDNSQVLTAVAACIWSTICHKTKHTWGDEEVSAAILACTNRLEAMAMSVHARLKSEGIPTLAQLIKTPVRELTTTQCCQLLVSQHGGECSVARRNAYLLITMSNPSLYFSDADQKSIKQWIKEEAL